MLALVFAAVALLPTAIAHEVPGDVLVRAYVSAEDERLRLLVRAPMESMQDMAFETTGPGYLDLPAVRASGKLEDAAKVWLGDVVEIFEGKVLLPAPEIVATRVSLPSDRSFATYEEALAKISGPGLPPETDIVWQQAMLDVLFEYPIRSEVSDFSIRPAPARLGLRVTTILHFLTPNGAVRTFELHGDPGLVRLDPRWHQAAWRFVEQGFAHILGGADHLLFLVCLVIPFRRLRPLIALVTAFTIAHTVTLIASVYGLVPKALWFPPLVETLIAASIVYMALENIVGADLKRRFVVAFAFGLVHGFGFSFALRESLQFAGSHVVASLLSFNVGVELGQILVLVLLVPALSGIFRFVVAERMGTILLSALVAHTSWHWMSERAGVLSQYRILPATLGGEQVARVLPWILLVLILLALVGQGLATLRSRQHSDGTATLPPGRVD